jgi:hypothetical protein
VSSRQQRLAALLGKHRAQAEHHPFVEGQLQAGVQAKTSPSFTRTDAADLSSERAAILLDLDVRDEVSAMKRVLTEILTGIRVSR